jgi:hypothetical protein
VASLIWYIKGEIFLLGEENGIIEYEDELTLVQKKETRSTWLQRSCLLGVRCKPSSRK